MTAALLALILAQARTPGVTVMAWDVDPEFPRLPNLVASQTPNAFFVQPNFALSGPLKSEYGPLEKTFVGEAFAQLRVPAAGDYAFRVESSHHARLTIFGELVCDTLDEIFRTANGQAEGVYKLAKGTCSVRLRFVHNAGAFRLGLSWRPPGAKSFTPIPDDLLTSEAGLTFVTSPGLKQANLGSPSTAPGDSRPLEDVHPSFTLENVRGPEFRPAVGGMCFLPDGRLAICTWDEVGAVYLIDFGFASGTKVTRFAAGLGEPLGIAWYQGDLYVTQKGEITRLRDTNRDGVADEFTCIAAGWPVSQNYHEFTFNLVPYQGKFYLGSSVPLRGGHTNYTPGSHGSYSVSNGPGSWIEVDPATGAWKRLATGLRTPNGMAIGTDGQMFVADNQGTWLPSSALYALRPGANYLHQEVPDGTAAALPPALWFPQDEAGNSPAEMILIPDGPYRGQMLIGDVTHGGLQRIALEKISGTYQGALFRHSQGLEAGINRLAWGPDGSLYVGGIGSNGNWNHLGHKFGLQRLRPNGKSTFEIQSVNLYRNGVLVTFTEPLAADAEKALAKLNFRHWKYVPTMAYGGPKVDNQPLKVKRTIVDKTGGRIFIETDGLEANRVVYANFRGVLNAAGRPLWSPEFWYTLNVLAPHDFAGFPSTRRAIFPAAPADAEVLIGPSGSSRLVRKSDGGPCDWTVLGDALEVRHDSKQSIGGNDMVSREPHGEVLLHVEWLSPPGGDPSKQHNGNSGIKLQERYEVQILNAPGIADPAIKEQKFNEAGSIYRQTAPSANPSYGPGVWQTYDIWFTPARWEGTRKTANARMTVYWNGFLVHKDVEVKQQTGMSDAESPNPGRLLLQDHENSSEGGVRFRNVWWVREPTRHGILPP